MRYLELDQAVAALNGAGGPLPPAAADRGCFAEQKLTVSAGTVAVLSFGLFHRGCRRGLSAPPRSMFKVSP